MTPTKETEMVAATHLTKSQAIPFRRESHESVGGITHVFLLLAVLLGAFAAVMWHARRKGWLNRWIPAAPIRKESTAGLQVEDMLRLSPKSTLYRVRSGNMVYLVMESSAQTQLLATAQPEEQDVHE